MNAHPAPAAVLAVLLAALSPFSLSVADNSAAAGRTGPPGNRDSDTAELLVTYYEVLLRDQDIARFQQQVAARYPEGTLVRLLESGDVTSRRASVLALGLIGTYGSNAAVARALRDSDATVRDLASNSLWSIWFRADSPENNAMLGEVQLLIRQERPDDAVKLATKLIARAPTFAEAYNQRAIAHFIQRRFQESADDCQRVLERNPYHFGALGGLAQCQLALGKRLEALKTLRRALQLQPFSQGLRATVAALEGEEV